MYQKKNSILKSSSGFSLVELMVVVAIIGILAAMSVGQVQKQIAKSRQSEAKTNLASLYTAEKSFYAEYAAYATHFNMIGAGFEGNLRYNVGFTNQVAVPNPPYTGAAPTPPIDAIGFCTAFPAQCTMVLSNGQAATGLNAALVPNSSAIAFTAGANSFIFNTALNDTWTINNNKQIQNPLPGIP